MNSSTATPNEERNRYNLLIQIGAALQKFPHLSLTDALSAGQIESKRWLIEELEKVDRPLGSVFVLGGWWGILPAMIFESRLRVEKIRSFDIDPGCARVADTINRRYLMDEWKFKASTQDMLSIDYQGHEYFTQRADGSSVSLRERADTIINTCCEHVAAFSAWWEKIPAGKLVALQSNNFSAPTEHCNCVASLDEFSESAPLRETLYRGELSFPDYKRFMLIGVK